MIYYDSIATKRYILDIHKELDSDKKNDMFLKEIKTYANAIK